MIKLFLLLYLFGLFTRKRFSLSTFGITAAGATAAAAVVGAGAATYSAVSGGKGGGKGGSVGGYDVVRLPVYDFTEPRLKAMSKFVENQFNSIGEGQIPAWLQNFLPQVRDGLNRGMEQSYFGLPGQRQGAIPTALQASAITGGGSGQAQRQVSRQLQNYTQMAKSIDQFIAEQSISGTQQTIRDAGSIGLGIPQGPPSTVVSYGGYPAQQSNNANVSQSIQSLAGTVGGIAANWQSKPSTGTGQSTLGGQELYNQFGQGYTSYGGGSGFGASPYGGQGLSVYQNPQLSAPQPQQLNYNSLNFSQYGNPYGR